MLTLSLFLQAYSRVTSWLQDWSLVNIKISAIDDINGHCGYTSAGFVSWETNSSCYSPWNERMKNIISNGGVQQRYSLNQILISVQIWNSSDVTLERKLLNLLFKTCDTVFKTFKLFSIRDMVFWSYRTLPRVFEVSRNNSIEKL